MRAVIVVLTLFAGPARGPIAIEWRGPEPKPSVRIAVREAVAERDGRPLAAVQDRALARARSAVSRELPATIRTLHAELRVALDEADATYREGRFAEARAQIDRTLEILHAHPELPGAAASAREAQLLAARIAWAEADVSATDQALVEALRLDPDATLAARRAPPELVARYEALQADLLAAREQTWITPTLSLAQQDQQVEIDGVPGVRPVPPGPHFVVVTRDGHEPIAAWRELDQPWTMPPANQRISTDPDVEHEAICAALGLALLVLAEQRDEGIGLQAYRCGEGWGSRWSGPRERIGQGTAVILAGPFEQPTASLAGAWTQPVGLAEPPTTTDGEPPRPWVRRGWVWGTAAGVAVAIVGGVVAGVLVGGNQPSTALDVDADDFLE